MYKKCTNHFCSSLINGTINKSVIDTLVEVPLKPLSNDQAPLEGDHYPNF